MLRLMRLANIVTAISDILAGVAISGYISDQSWQGADLRPVVLLVISTVGLYGGGVVFNDVFDAELDKVERPERPIPSGLIKKETAALFATLLLFAGILHAYFVHPQGISSPSTILAITIAFASVVYDRWGKHYSFLGPLNMGLCRGLNLLLGISVLPDALYNFWWLGFVPVVYIAAITMVSRGEVHGGKRSTLYGAVALYVTVIAAILLVGASNNRTLFVSVFLLPFMLMIFPPLKRAIHEPVAPFIGKAVKAGVIALIMMNAAWAAAFGSLYLALLIVLLLPLSLWLAKLFAVT
ncbi:UbiA-like protein EboC [Flavitalea antarctica]